MEEKYIDLLLKKCINLNESKCLFISYDIINQSFIDKLVNKAKLLEVKEIFLHKTNIYEEHDILQNIKLEDIESHPYFDYSIYNKYALKNSNFLIFRSPIPNIMNDIDPKKISTAELIKRKTSYIYKDLQSRFEIPWCIAVLPNQYWANEIFDNNENSFHLLENVLYNICMINENDPIKNWSKHLEINKKRVKQLNQLKIKLLHYKNSLGTDLILEFSDYNIWCDASENGLVNMPSYEIFTSPDYRKTNGIVYSSRPLIYNGSTIDNFWLKFKNGKVIDFAAEKGEETLKSIIESDSNSCYLGECALVENNSPISKTNLVFGLTLLDENASSHLALGKGFPICINENNLTEKQLLEKGINISKVHVDFMIGTPDLEVEAQTFDGKKIKILENGCFKK